MIVVDIGNTNIVIGFYFKGKISNVSRFDTKSDITFFLNKIYNKKFFDKTKLDYKSCIISSVAPSFDKYIINFFKKYKFKIISFNQFKNLKIKIDKPKELGKDRIANSVAAIKKYGKNCLILDFGTATTFDVINDSKYIGGVIAPGIMISHDSLVKNASKLKKISIYKTNKVVGKNTAKAMRSGFYWGYIGLINTIIDKIMKEKKFKPKIILTGGLAKIFMKKINFKITYDPYLTLDGLYLIGLNAYEKN